MDLEAFTSGKANSCITPLMIAAEIKRVLSLEGYLGSVSFEVKFRSEEREGIEFWSMLANFCVGDKVIIMELRPRHLMLSLDEFLVKIIMPHLSHLIYK